MSAPTRAAPAMRTFGRLRRDEDDEVIPGQRIWVAPQGANGEELHRRLGAPVVVAREPVAVAQRARERYPTTDVIVVESGEAIAEAASDQGDTEKVDPSDYELAKQRYRAACKKAGLTRDERLDWQETQIGKRSVARWSAADFQQAAEFLEAGVGLEAEEPDEEETGPAELEPGADPSRSSTDGGSPPPPRRSRTARQFRTALEDALADVDKDNPVGAARALARVLRRFEPEAETSRLAAEYAAAELLDPWFDGDSDVLARSVAEVAADLSRRPTRQRPSVEVEEGEEGDAEPPPTLEETWRESLEDYLDPDPFLLRPSDVGMGRDLDRQLGGGLSVGQTAALVSLGAGRGKTTLLHQFADGVAARSAAILERAAEQGEVPVVVPVILVSEMTTRDLSLRSLARQAGVEGYLLRDPRGPRGRRPLADGVTYGEDALQKAAVAARKFEDAAQFITPVDRRTRVSVPDLEEAVHRVRGHWEDEDCTVPAALVVIDPIHRVLDPTRPEVEALGRTLQEILDLAQRTRSIVLFSSDTTKRAAYDRKDAGAKESGEELAHAAEMGFRGSYQLLHLPDVALGLITMSERHEHLSPEDSARLQREPEGTLYSEVVNAKSRWDKAGRRAAFFLDAAKFRFRPTDSRDLAGEWPLTERILRFVEAHPDCSQRAVRDGVTGSHAAIRSTVDELLRNRKLVDHGDATTGYRLRIPEDPHRTGTGPPQDHSGTTPEDHSTTETGPDHSGPPPDHPRDQDEGRGVVRDALPIRGESIAEDHPVPAPRADRDERGDEEEDRPDDVEVPGLLEEDT